MPLQGRFVLSFNKADIVDVLEQASRWTCRNFIYTDDVARGKITLLSKTPVTSDEAYAAFLAALSANNITIYATGKYYKLGRSPDSKKLPIPTYTDPRLGHAGHRADHHQGDPAAVDRRRPCCAACSGNFISPQGADIQSIPPDTLIITDIGLNIRRIERMLESIDRPGGGDLIHIVQLRYAAAKDVADKLNQIFQAQGTGPDAARPLGRRSARPVPGARRPAPPAPAQPARRRTRSDVSVSKVLPDERTNKLIVIADDKSFQRVQELLEQLDVPTGADGGIHVVFLKNASAEELATTLSSLAQGQAKRTGPRPRPPPAPAAGPGLTCNRAPPPAPAAAAEAAATAELFSGEVKITADKAQNALLVQASGADFAAISRLIEKLDRARRQVFVEAVVMEVNLTNQTDLGVGAHGFVDVNVNGKKGVLPLISAPGQVSSLNAGQHRLAGRVPDRLRGADLGRAQGPDRPVAALHRLAHPRPAVQLGRERHLHAARAGHRQRGRRRSRSARTSRSRPASSPPASPACSTPPAPPPAASSACSAPAASPASPPASSGRTWSCGSR